MIRFFDFDGVLHPEREENPEFFTNAPVLWRRLRVAPRLMVVHHHMAAK